ncbi:MAG TPA: dienelactone hydrolase family protein [Verrucomicrobiales bacterium]|nr:dienelactone hydrolase family protein [Verrucomicrobiales bacterium]
MKTILRSLFLTVCLLSPVSSPAGEIATKAVEYKQADTTLEGYLAVPKEVSGKVPAILLIHDWMGVGTYAKERANELAGLGYVVLAADIYGKGVRPDGPPGAAKLAGQYKGDRALYRKRLLAGLEQLKSNPNVDASKVAAIGYCFGGTGVLELARAGADVKGVVSFHGGLDSPTPADGKNIKARVLILHGADDPNVPAAGIAAMTKEFNDAGVDWQMISYSGAVHSFSNPHAGTDKSKGNAYDEKTDKRSWEHMMVFFKELFGK